MCELQWLQPKVFSIFGRTNLVEKGSTTDVAGFDGGAIAKASSRELIKEDGADVDLAEHVGTLFPTWFKSYVCGSDEGVSNDTATADIVGVSAAETARVDELANDKISQKMTNIRLLLLSLAQRLKQALTVLIELVPK